MANIKIAGYILSGIGLAGVLLSSYIEKITFVTKILGTKTPLYTIVGSLILVAVGIVLILSESKGGSKIKHASPEVPIYEGTGKHRKIVGYQKA